MEVDEGIITSEADEKREVERLSVVATVGILIATIAAAVGGSLAALASVHGDDANSRRLAWATYSNEMLLSYNDHATNQGEGLTTQLENAWRFRLLEDIADNTTDPAMRSELGSEAFQAIGQPRAPTADEPTFSSPSPAQWCRSLLREYDCAYEVANAYGTTSLNDNRQERAYIACVSMLAIALFLFALSKMLSQPSMERLFLVLGALITLVAVGWMAAEQLLTPATQPSGSAIKLYEAGWQREQTGGRPTIVEAYLRRATSADPSLDDAWQQLGEEELLQARHRLSPDQCRTAIAALTHAMDLRHAPDDLDRLAVGEVLCGDPAGAKSLLRHASPGSSDVLAGPPAMALAQLASGQWKTASMTLDAAVWSMRHQGEGLPGPVFTSYWFDQVFTEVTALRTDRGRPAHLDAFIERMEHDEALVTLADFHVPVRQPAPHASVQMSAPAVTSTFGSAGGWVPRALDLRYSDLRNGDVIVLMWDEYRAVESSKLISLTLPGTTVLVVGQPGGPAAGTGTFVVPTVAVVSPGTYHIEVTLDGVASSAPVLVPVSKGQTKGGPVAIPLALAFTGPQSQTTTTTTPTAPPTTTTTSSCDTAPTTPATTGTISVPTPIAVGCAAPSP